MKNKAYLLPLIIGAALAAGIFIGGKLRFTDTPERIFASNSNKDKLNRLIDYIDHEYVDDVNTDSIVDITVDNILKKLDPHSVYIPNSQTKSISETMKGEFVGVGIQFRMQRDTLMVIRTIEGGPAEKAGLKAGDRILVANSDTLSGKRLNSEYVISQLKGENETAVNLKIYRKTTGQILPVTLKRAAVPIQSVDAFYMLDDTIGYIKLNRFAETSYKEFKTALSLLKSNGAKAITLDLRDNPGGYMTVAEKIVDEFLPDNTLIVFTKDRKGKVVKTFATEKGAFENGQVYVLVNEKSASASEIVAGALQDNDVGTIVGRRSFGKGLVQREMPLPDGSAVRLTVSRYYTPTGRSVQRSYANGTDEYYIEDENRRNSLELRYVDSIKTIDSLKFTTPKGKTVYGGGGIIPDVFVPLTSTREDDIVTYILETGLVSYFVFEELDKDRASYEKIKENDFVKYHQIADTTIEDFQDFLRSHQITHNLSAYKKTIGKYIKANMAEQLYGNNAYERILQQDDTMLQKVKELYHNKQ